MADGRNLEWDEKFHAVASEEMNTQHQNLIRKMSQLSSLSDENQSSHESLLATLREMRTLVTEHFEAEEKLMEETAHKLISVHKKMHEQLLRGLDLHINRFTERRADKLPEEFFQFLRLWLQAHIQGMDTQYGNGRKEKSA